VVSIAQAAADPDQTKAPLAGSPLDKTATYYRVVVEPDRQFVDVAGEPHALPANMRVEAYALLDRRPLYRWICSRSTPLAARRTRVDRDIA
jgi:hypothetical protein